MITFILNVMFFGVAVCAHLCLCRRSKVKDLKTKLFVILAVCMLMVFWMAMLLFHLPMPLTNTVIFLAMVPVYLIFYVSTELMSPSKRVLQVLESFPGSTYDDIYQALERENFLSTRLTELEQCGMVVREGARYRLAPAGRKFAAMWAVVQKLLCREMGG